MMSKDIPPPPPISLHNREWILRQLQCPFQGKTPGASKLFCSQIHTPTGCPFGHQSQLDNQPSPSLKIPESKMKEKPESPPYPIGSSLVPIPEGICIQALMEKCDAKDPGACSNGAHPSMQELADKCKIVSLMNSPPK